MEKHFLKNGVTFLLLLVAFQALHGQTEMEPWGNITGIRIDGQLMEFETGVTLLHGSWSSVTATGKEKQHPKYSREKGAQVVVTNLDSLYLREEVADGGPGRAQVHLAFVAKDDIAAGQVYLVLTIPTAFYAHGSVGINRLRPVLIRQDAVKLKKYLQAKALALRFISLQRQLTITFGQPVHISYQTENGSSMRFFLLLHDSALAKGEAAKVDFVIAAAGNLDKRPVTISVDTAHPGRPFAGLGGNFRLQNPKLDPEVIDFCLKNLRVAWGRVEMPWMFWQPDIDSSPIAAAQSGRWNKHVQQSMEMAQRLYQIGMPLVLTAWFPPQWAVVGPLHFRPGPDHIWGNALDTFRYDQIYTSIGDYIQYLKDKYGVEIADFSFNESDLGINIRQTAEEHDRLIKGLGAYFVSRGLRTKILLGDNSDANTFDFIGPALNDTAARRYIGAVSFHSWRGWDTVTLQKWADAATRLRLPLLVGEGSIDAAAWAYPAIFEEPTYALKEISLYLRLLAVCQPESILQWQLTSDYSPVAGGGIYGDTSVLRPTQRFWNLKQLASTPKDLRAMPLKIRGVDVSGAALGDNARCLYSIQLVNNGPARPVTMLGIPGKVAFFRVWVTDSNNSMREMARVKNENGKARFILAAAAYTTLASQ